MIRFFDRSIGAEESIDVTVLQDHILFGENIWKDGKVHFRNYLSHDVSEVVMLPVKDENGEIICRAYLDDEANRELRMLKELENYENALQMKDVFPEIQEVIIVGCNELAYYFARYLEKQHIRVAVVGKYWEWFGYQCDIYADFDDANRMVVYAEGRSTGGGYLHENVIKSVSPEFECIDKIYEANVHIGRIKDTEGDLSSVLDKLRGKRIVILETDEKSQDVYDFLYSHGIDISCFVKKEVPNAVVTLLGKKVMNIRDVMRMEKDAVFIDCHSKNSAMGNRTVEMLDYYGYVRNRQLFLINDYTDIPFSNLVHVLKNKSVYVAGDERLCHILSEYLEDVEQGEVDVKCIKISQYSDIREQNMLFIVYPWYGVEQEYNPKFRTFEDELLQRKNISYSTYFSRTASLAIIDQYINRQKEKYSTKHLIPKGILLGRIPTVSGNIFLRSILDGHPDILKWGHNRMNKNLFLYCIRLAKENAENIINSFKKLFLEELVTIADFEIPRWDIFEKSIKRRLSLKDSFSSQELFVIFHIAYAEMMSGEKISDVGDKIIYWEPHQLPRNEFSYLAQWLEDEKINGQTIYMHRDHIVWIGSHYKFYPASSPSLEAVSSLAVHNMLEAEEKYQTWKEFHVRFEDVKLHPKQELMRICNRFEIPWSDTFHQSTNEGEAWFYHEVRDFDLRPVLNNYEEYLSVFDRFRIALIARSYQKRYGYAYEDSMKFSRRELQEMFLRPFRFQEGLIFKSKKECIEYYRNAFEIIRWDLWEVHKHEVLNDITPLFGRIELFESAYKEQQKTDEIHRLINFVRHQEKLILYGTGKDCEALLDKLGGDRPEIIFCDLKAVYKEITFQGEKVISPTELNGQYNSYKILITPSRHYGTIRNQLEHLFEIDPDRITCNTYQLWEDEK